MSKREYCDRLAVLLAEGVKAERENRIADKCRIFAVHDDMIANPQNYIKLEA